MVINELGTSSSLFGYRQTTEILAARYGAIIFLRKMYEKFLTRWSYDKKK